MTAQEQEPRKLGLMIGINKYKNLGRRFQLKGCVNDQKMLKGIILERFGFKEDNIQTLFDEQATRTNILKGLDRLAGMGEYEDNPLVQEGDFVLISYTGHGSRLKEPADEQDEADGYDSTVVPYDSDRRRPVGKGGKNLDITDDELHKRFQKIKKRAAHLLLYFDCCHSGTISRDLTGELARSLIEDDRYDDIDRGEWPFGDRLIPTGPSGWLPMDEGYILITGCADDEVALEYKDPVTRQPCGALTYHMIQEMAQSEGQLTYRDVFERARANVNRLFPRQHPQMEGDWNRKLFEAKEVLVEPFTNIKIRNKRLVELQVGSVHGTTVNSLWEIRAPGLEDREALAYVLVRSVKQLTSIAEVSIQPSEEMEWDDFIAQANQQAKSLVLPRTVNDKCRAIQVVHALGDLQLPVAVMGPDIGQTDQLQRKIASSTLLKLVPEIEQAELIAALIEPRSDEELDDLNSIAPELGAVSDPTWIIVGRDRSMMPTPPHTIDEKDVLDLTWRNLETWARYFNTHKIRPVGKDPLRGKFTAQLFAMPEDDNDLHDPRPLPIHQQSGLPLVEDGQEVLLKVYNHHSKPLYFFICSMDAMGGIQRIYPPIGAQEPLAANDEFPIAIPIELPEKFPKMLNGGQETLKIMVTPKYVSFDVMVQEKTRFIVGDDMEEIDDATEETHEASQWFGAASRGASMSSVRPLKRKVDKDAWTAVQLDYYLKRSAGAWL